MFERDRRDRAVNLSLGKLRLSGIPERPAPAEKENEVQNIITQLRGGLQADGRTPLTSEQRLELGLKLKAAFGPAAEETLSGESPTSVFRTSLANGPTIMPPSPRTGFFSLFRKAGAESA